MDIEFAMSDGAWIAVAVIACVCVGLTAELVRAALTQRKGNRRKERS